MKAQGRSADLAPDVTVPALELENLTKVFGDVTAVDDVSVKIERGEFFSLLGPSGCGKSTTLRIIAGFETPTRGRLLLDGLDATGTPPFRRPTNLVFQNYALFPHMNVYRNVAFGPRRAGLPSAEVDRRVGEALRTVRMEGFADRMPSQLSGGQQQRVGLARALVNRPLVLLLDEPLGALDLRLRQEMQLELKRIQREVGISFVYVTHDQEEAMTMSDRIAVMHAGRLLQVDAPREIYFHPRSRFVAEFIGTANLLPSILERVMGTGAEVRLAGRVVPVGSVGATDDRRLHHGDRVWVMIRPECVELQRDRSTRAVSLDAVVEDVIFQGTSLRVQLRGPEGASIVATTSVEGADWRPGERVSVSWDPSRAHVVGDEA